MRGSESHFDYLARQLFRPPFERFVKHKEYYHKKLELLSELEIDSTIENNFKIFIYKLKSLEKTLNAAHVPLMHEVDTRFVDNIAEKIKKLTVFIDEIINLIKEGEKNEQ